MKSTLIIRRTLSRAKVLTSRTLGAFRSREDILNLRFYRDRDGWFVDLPTWPGPKAALAMVDGADTFLERLGEHHPEVVVQVSQTPKPLDQGWFQLDYLAPHFLNDGAYYRTQVFGHPHDMWLCGVTVFVLGRMPQTIYVRKND